VVEKSSAQVRERAGYIISDTMENTWHPATGKYVSSKSRFRQMTRDAGCTEVGNDSSLYRKRQEMRLSSDERSRDIKRAIDQLRSR
jgi:hypothetical protein